MKIGTIINVFCDKVILQLMFSDAKIYSDTYELQVY